MKRIKNLKSIGKYLIFAALGALTAGSRIMGIRAPFAAVLAALSGVDCGIAAAVGTLFGGLFGFSPDMIPVLASAGTVLLAKLKGCSRRACISTAAVTAGVYLMSSCALCALSGGGLGEIAGLFLMSSGLGASVLVSLITYRDLRSARGIGGTRLLFFAAAFVCALMRAGISPVSLGGIAASYIALFCAVRLGPEAAASAAFACALGAGLSSPREFAGFILLGLPAVLCGRLFFGSPMKASACFVLTLLPAYVLFGTGDRLSLFLDAAIAAALFVPTQRHAAAIYSRYRDDVFQTVRSRPEAAMEAAIVGLKSRLEALPPSFRDTRPLSDVVWTKVCINCVSRETCAEGSKQGLPRLDAITAEPSLGDVCRALPDCSRITEIKNTGAEAFRRREYLGERAKSREESLRLCAGLLDAFGEAVGDVARLCRDSSAENRLLTSQLIASLRKRGIRPESVSVFAGGRASVSLKSGARISVQKMTEAVAEVTGLGYAPPESFEHPGGTVYKFEPDAEYTVETGLCQVPAGEKISGDITDSFDCGGYSYVLLSDGMGVGEQARAAAYELSSRIREMICAGFSVRTAAGICSSVLRCVLPEESFATLDLLRVNRKTGAAELYKAGGCKSFIFTDGSPSTVAAGGYPIGILDSCDLRVQRFYVRESASVVMVTDGALGITPNECMSALNCGIDLPPAQLAALLMARLEPQKSAKRDDASVAVVRIGRKSA